MSRTAAASPASAVRRSRYGVAGVRGDERCERKGWGKVRCGARTTGEGGVDFGKITISAYVARDFWVDGTHDWRRPKGSPNPNSTMESKPPIYCVLLMW